MVVYYIPKARQLFQILSSSAHKYTVRIARVNQDHLRRVIQFSLGRTEPGITFAYIYDMKRAYRGPTDAIFHAFNGDCLRLLKLSESN